MSDAVFAEEPRGLLPSLGKLLRPQVVEQVDEHPPVRAQRPIRLDHLVAPAPPPPIPRGKTAGDGSDVVGRLSRHAGAILMRGADSILTRERVPKPCSGLFKKEE